MRQQERPRPGSGGSHPRPPTVFPSSSSSPSGVFCSSDRTAWFSPSVSRRLPSFSPSHGFSPSGRNEDKKTINANRLQEIRFPFPTSSTFLDGKKRNVVTRAVSSFSFSSSFSAQNEATSLSAPVLSSRVFASVLPWRFLLLLLLLFLLSCLAAVSTLVYFFTLPSRLPPLLTSSSLPLLVSRPPGIAVRRHDLYGLSEPKRVSSGSEDAGQVVSYFLPFDEPPFGMPRDRPLSSSVVRSSYSSYSASSSSSFARSSEDLKTAKIHRVPSRPSVFHQETGKQQGRKGGRRGEERRRSSSRLKEFFTSDRRHLLPLLHGSPPRRLYSSTTIQVGPPADYSGFSFDDLWNAFKSSPQEYLLLLWFVASLFMFCSFCSWLCRQRSFQKAVLVSP